MADLFALPYEEPHHGHEDYHENDHLNHVAHYSHSLICSVATAHLIAEDTPGIRSEY
jgi:hypothetical protein